MREGTAYQVDRRLGLGLGSGMWYLQGLALFVFQDVDPEVF